MSEHNEPWEVDYDEGTNTWDVESTGKSLIAEFNDKHTATRAVLCVNACAGRSDKFVMEMPYRIKAGEEVRDVTVKQLNEVEAQLDETLELLERILEYGYKQSLGYDVSIKAILVKHKKGE
ncbi:hypothetical protein LCGC14_1981850 [marine sediment metagenome]|uniref:Uncharacterized protein n=1 Tax=marine sediment metagenome TaxID=412755 RepID=A0A0F9F8L1_9ZZZZ